MRGSAGAAGQVTPEHNVFRFPFRFLQFLPFPTSFQYMQTRCRRSSWASFLPATEENMVSWASSPLVMSPVGSSTPLQQQPTPLQFFSSSPPPPTTTSTSPVPQMMTDGPRLEAPSYSENRTSQNTRRSTPSGSKGQGSVGPKRSLIRSGLSDLDAFLVQANSWGTRRCATQ